MPVSDSTNQANAPQHSEPIVIAKFWASLRSKAEHFRISIGEHKGRKLISVRIWRTGPDGRDYPTERGFPLIVAKLPELTCALLRAEDRAREMGLLPPVGGTRP